MSPTNVFIFIILSHLMVYSVINMMQQEIDSLAEKTI